MKKQRGIADLMFVLILIAIGLAIGWRIGRLGAHEEISTECERLGGFFYGSTNYRCEVKKP